MYIFRESDDVLSRKFFNVIEKYESDFKKYNVTTFFLMEEDEWQDTDFNPIKHVHAAIMKRIDGVIELHISEASINQDEDFIECIICHELGHLRHGHSLDQRVNDRDIQKEFQADEYMLEVVGPDQAINFLEIYKSNSWDTTDNEFDKRINNLKLKNSEINNT